MRCNKMTVRVISESASWIQCKVLFNLPLSFPPFLLNTKKNAKNDVHNARALMWGIIFVWFSGTTLALVLSP